MAGTSRTISSEQFAARELVRDWAAGSGATEAARDIEQGEPKAWQPVFDGLAGLGVVESGCRIPGAADPALSPRAGARSSVRRGLRPKSRRKR